MVAIKQSFPHHLDGSIDIHTWLQKVSDQYGLKDINLITTACELAETSSKGLTTFYGQPYIEQSLEMAKIILDLQLDQDAIAATIIANIISISHITPERITEMLGENVKKLVVSFSQLNLINSLVNTESRDQIQIDRLRKTFLAMASDIRVVLIKLAERITIMRGIKNINFLERKRYAQETMNLYAPLANRLGLGQLKWELEDIAFHYGNPDIYKNIAGFLAERRADREERISDIITRLNGELSQVHINAELTGRAKHIYSIYLKMKQKERDLKDIYDYSAVRILVPKISDCYTALSIVHSIWEHIPDEFDDYISNPKSNGYRSIHTAVRGSDGKSIEIQIRTHDMHNEAEHGIAAHWLYKENKINHGGYEEKITFLRQLLAWHKEVASDNSVVSKAHNNSLEDRIYVFTPAGDILDLDIGSTPLDFAYQVHSEVGHCCRGAKINKHIVPLTYKLQTGDHVEIITTKNGTPSRDWLNKETGYIKTARARAKVAQWFRQQEIKQYIELGKQNLERELSRAGISSPNMQKIAARLHFKNEDALFASIGHGTVRLNQILQVAQAEQNTTGISTPILPMGRKPLVQQNNPNISGANDLLTRVALCCKPIPGDLVVGYITQGRGISIHRKNCANVTSLYERSSTRFMDVSWDEKKAGNYFVDLKIRARAEEDLIRQIPAVLSNLKIDLINLNSTNNKKTNIMFVIITIQLYGLEELQQVLTQLKNLRGVIDVKRTQE